jgi:NAD(P) transhydrogenase subunit alpha
VALVPREVSHLVAAGHEVMVPAGAGSAAGFDDASYESAGARILADPATEADVLFGIGPLGPEDAAGVRVVIGLLDPLGSPEVAAALADKGLTAFSMEMIPRTTLAQSMDVLSSQATAAGYAAVLLGAMELPRFFPMLMTAAGTIRPARVLVLGAGVAGLQAIAVARRLGAVVSGYDIRPAAREQVESLGAKFVGGPVAAQAEDAGGYATAVDEETRRSQQAALAKAVAGSDVVITAQVPGGKAPLLVTEEMVESMKPGSVVIDLAAATGGNCAVTRADERVMHHGVIVLGPTNLAATTAGDASEMYSRNITALFDHLSVEGRLDLQSEDEIAAGACVAHGGRVVSERVRALLGMEG